MHLNADLFRAGRAAVGDRLSPAMRVAWGLIAAVALLLIARTVVLVYAMARPMPYWDAWEFMKALPAITTGRYTLTDLLGFHNEHRIVTTRLIMLIDTHFFAASGYFSTAMTVVVLCAIGGILSVVTIGRSPIGTAVALVITSLLLSVAQSENFSSGFQVQFPLVDLFAIAAIGFLVRAKSAPHPALFVAAAIAADALAIASMASGNTLVGPLLLVAVALRLPVVRTALVIVPALVMSALYAVGFPKSSIPSSHDPVGIAHFAVDYLGATLRGYPHASPVLGAISLAAFVAMVVEIVRRWVRRDHLDPILIWLAGLAAFLVSGALVTGMGRLSLGLETAISSRYAIQSLLFVGCVLLMGWRLTCGQPGRAPVRLGLAATGLAVSLASTLAASPLAEWQARVADYDAAGTAFAEGVMADDFIKGVYPFPDLIRPTLMFMQDHRLGPFSSRYADLYRPPVNALGSRPVDTLPLCANSQDTVSAIGPHWVEVRGWAFERQNPKESGWIVAFDAGLRVIGFARQTVDRPDVAVSYRLPRSMLGYRVGLNLDRRAPGTSHDITLVLVPEDAHATVCRVATKLPGTFLD